MDIYRTEEEQVKAIKEWWHDNGKSIVAGIVFGIIAVFSWRGYNDHLISQAENASILYDKMLVAAQATELEAVELHAEQIIADYDSTTYAVFAALMLAKLAVESDDLTTAETHLRWVLANNSQNEIQHIATLRLIRVLMASDQLAAAAAMLANSIPEQFVAQYEELRGDLIVKQGQDKALARQAYEYALAHLADEDEAARSILTMKLYNLGET